MPRPKKDLQQLARTHTEAAIRTLFGIMKQPKAQASARVQAANSILDRGWGKAAQPHTGEGGEGPILFQQLYHEIDGITRGKLPGDTETGRTRLQ